MDMLSVINAPETKLKKSSATVFNVLYDINIMSTCIFAKKWYLNSDAREYYIGIFPV